MTSIEREYTETRPKSRALSADSRYSASASSLGNSGVVSGMPV